MIDLRLHLEHISGDWFGWIEGHPGAFSQGATPREVEWSAGRWFADYLNWLKAHGEPPPAEFTSLMSADFAPIVADTLREAVGAPWESRHTFPQDAHAMPADEFERHLRLLRYARTDLSEAVHGIPPHEWDTAPLGELSIRALLQRIATCDTAFLECIARESAAKVHPDPWTNLVRLRMVFESNVHEVFSRREANHGVLQRVLRLAIWNDRRITRDITIRSNPVAYLRSVMRDYAVVRQPDAAARSERNIPATEEAPPVSRHAHGSGYYY
jgi:hypothetical protein